MATEQIKTPFVYVYNNPKLAERCIAFSYYGSVLLQKLFKQENVKCKIQVKRHIICDEPQDGIYSPYHYYIELRTPNRKYIIDYSSKYCYWFYIDKYKPKGTIEIVKNREINKVVKEGIIEDDVGFLIFDTILYYFDKIKCKNSIKWL